MDIKGKLSGVGKIIKKKYREREERIQKKRKILKTLTMRDYKELEKLYNITITFSALFHDSPTENNYVDGLARSHITIKGLKDYIAEKNEEKSKGQIPTQLTQISQVTMSGGTLVGNVAFVNIFNKFSTEIISSNLDLKIKTEAIRQIKELEMEIQKPNKDESKINKIIKWFTENKKLATIATPIIAEIISKFL